MSKEKILTEADIEPDHEELLLDALDFERKRVIALTDENKKLRDTVRELLEEFKHTAGGNWSAIVTGEHYARLQARLESSAAAQAAPVSPDLACRHCAQPEPAAPTMLDLYREALERLADEDTPVLDEGLGGGAQEELHVRASFAGHTLGRDTCGCTECRVSLGLDDQDEDPGRHPDGCSCQFCREDIRDAEREADDEFATDAASLDSDFDEDEQRAADIQAHVSGQGGPSPAYVTGDAAGVASDTCPGGC